MRSRPTSSPGSISFCAVFWNVPPRLRLFGLDLESVCHGMKEAPNALGTCGRGGPARGQDWDDTTEACLRVGAWLRHKRREARG
jgi:hypothetical protein